MWGSNAADCGKRGNQPKLICGPCSCKGDTDTATWACMHTVMFLGKLQIQGRYFPCSSGFALHWCLRESGAAAAKRPTVFTSWSPSLSAIKPKELAERFKNAFRGWGELLFSVGSSLQTIHFCINHWYFGWKYSLNHLQCQWQWFFELNLAAKWFINPHSSWLVAKRDRNYHKSLKKRQLCKWRLPSLKQVEEPSSPSSSGMITSPPRTYTITHCIWNLPCLS